VKPAPEQCLKGRERERETERERSELQNEE